MASLSTPIALVRDLATLTAREERAAQRVQHIESFLLTRPELTVRRMGDLKIVRHLVRAGYEGDVVVDGVARGDVMRYALKHGFAHLVVFLDSL